MAERNVNKVESSSTSYRDAEALNNKVEKEDPMLEEVVRIKKIVDNSKNEPASLVLDSLQKLQRMSLNIEILKATEIGKPVNVLRKHASKDIRAIAQRLVKLWKHMVDEWLSETPALDGGSEGNAPNSVNPPVVDEDEGLLSPPLEDFSFLPIYDTPMDLCNFFDSLDDDLNPLNCEEINKNTGVDRHNIPKQKQQLPTESLTHPKTKEELSMKGEPSMKKQATMPEGPEPIDQPCILESASRRSAKPNKENKAPLEAKLPEKQKLSSPRLPAHQQKETRYSEVDAAQQKLETTKRKLHERYQQVENAKRRRAIQVLELHDLPKQGNGQRNRHVESRNQNGNRNRQPTHGRR